MHIGLVGVGRWGKKHLSVLNELKKANQINRITVIDHDEHALSKVTTADEKLLDVRGLNADGVIIATPSQTHAELAKSLLRSGHDLLVEKPLATDLNAATQVMNLAQQNGRLLYVGMLLRHHFGIKKAKYLIQLGQIGRLNSITYQRKKTHPNHSDFPAMSQLGIHGIDLACFFAGEAEPTSTIFETSHEKGLASFFFPQGISAQIETEYSFSENISKIVLTGEKGLITINLQEDQGLSLHQNGFTKHIPIQPFTKPLMLQTKSFLMEMKRKKQGDDWSHFPDFGASMRCLRLLEKAGILEEIIRPN